MRAYQVTSLLQKPPRQREAAGLTERLDEALAAKMLGVLRGRRHHFMARRNGSLHAVDMFLAHSNQEQAHADLIAARIVELEGDPEFAPASLLLGNHAPFFERGSRVLEMAREDQDATRLAAGLFAEILRAIGSSDAATKKLLQSIVEADRFKAAELTTLIASLEAR
jgi:bacterioferritin